MLGRVWLCSLIRNQKTGAPHEDRSDGHGAEALAELIEGEQKQIIQELDHTDSRDYKAILMERLGAVEGLLAKAQSRTA